MSTVEMRELVTITIDASASQSDVVYLGSNMALAGLILPVGSGSFTAATERLRIDVDFRKDGDDASATMDQPSTYDGAAVDESLIVVAANNTDRHFTFSADKWDGYNLIQIQALAADGTTPVTQTGAVTLYAIVRPY